MDLLKGLVGDPAKIGEGLTSYGSDLKTSIGTEGDWDVVMVLPVTPSDEESKEEDVENANRKFFEATIEKLASAGLQYKSYYSIQGDEIYVKIRSPEDRLEGQADVRDVPMLMDPSKLEKALAAGFPELQIAPIDIGTDCDGQAVSRFAPSQHIYCKYDRHPSLLPLYSHPANATSPFRSMQRIKLVTDIIQTLHRFGGCEISVGKEINDGKMLAFMCLHDPIERTALYHKWMTYPWAAPVSQMPFDEYKDYFGEQAALYMASLGHATTYTAWLGALGLVATTIIQVIGFDSKPAAYCRAIFGVALFAWLAAYHDGWRKTEQTYALKWGMTEFEAEEPERPQFRGAAGGDHHQVRRAPRGARALRQQALGPHLARRHLPDVPEADGCDYYRSRRNRYLSIAGIGVDQPFFATRAAADAAAARNAAVFGALSRAPLAPRDGAAPDVVFVGAIEGPEALIPLANNTYLPLAMGPEYVGTGSGVVDVPYAKHWPWSDNGTYAIGGYVESWAFGSTPVAAGDDGTTVALAKRLFSLNNAVGIASMAPAALLTHLPEVLEARRRLDGDDDDGDAGSGLLSLVPTFRLWAPAEGVAPDDPPDFFAVGDGGDLDNFGILHLLQRGLDRIVVFDACEDPLAPADAWDPYAVNATGGVPRREFLYGRKRAFAVGDGGPRRPLHPRHVRPGRQRRHRVQRRQQPRLRRRGPAAPRGRAPGGERDRRRRRRVRERDDGRERALRHRGGARRGSDLRVPGPAAEVGRRAPRRDQGGDRRRHAELPPVPDDHAPGPVRRRGVAAVAAQLVGRPRARGPPRGEAPVS